MHNEPELKEIQTDEGKCILGQPPRNDGVIKYNLTIDYGINRRNITSIV